MNKLSTCKKCKTKPIHPVYFQQTYTRFGREFIEEKEAYKTFACKCGKCMFFGDLDRKSNEKVFLDKPIEEN